MTARKQTSQRVSKIAGRILAVKVPPGDYVHVKDQRSPTGTFFEWSDLRALAASALSQDEKPAPKRPKR